MRAFSDFDRRCWPTVERWLEALLGFLYPNCCQICCVEPATPKQGFVCERCRQRPDGVRLISEPFCHKCGLPYEGQITGEFVCGNCSETELQFSHARAAVVATELVLEVIHRYKYRRAMWFEPFLAGLLTSQAVPELSVGAWDWVVPVPLHPVKQRGRGFNQSLRLARRLSRATGVALNNRLLRRVEATQTQTLLSRAQRAANVRKAFAMRPDHGLKGDRIVLVDDVLTTGATASACAEALMAAGAAEVCVWTVARGA